ncbi:MAG: ABC transporter permease [Bacteroidota bacterium]|nr:ABC transporter permease [Bacteroidota bacterium]
MKFEYFIARRLFFQHDETRKKAGPAVKIAVTGIALGLAVMLVAVAVVLGFKQEVRNKLIGVGSHVQITSYYSNNTYEMSPIATPDSLIKAISQVPGVRHVQCLYTKPGMIKTPDDFQAVVFKGADAQFDRSFLTEALVDGKFPDYSKPSNQALISEYLSKLLRLKTGDSFLVYFIKEGSISARKFNVSGVFNTHFSSFDKHFILVDARHLVRLNNWSPGQSGGLEIFFKSMDHFDEVEDGVYGVMSQYARKHNSVYYMRNLFELNPDMFGWLDLLDTNVMLILLLMIFVSGFNIISGLLILMLERTNMIGVLKALGANNQKIRRIFISYSTYLIGVGLLFGNAIGLGICFIQHYFHLLKLDPSIYYVDSVPININFLYVLLINVGTIFISMLVVLIPSHLISHIHPVKAIRFD